jgi:hypothetical protein
MQVANVSGLKNNPSDALRKARDDLVVVMNCDRPDAMLLGLTANHLLDQPGVRAALATYRWPDQPAWPTCRRQSFRAT